MESKKPNRFAEKLKELERALREFWSDYGQTPVIKGANSEIVIEPRMIVAEKINPEVARRLIVVYLSQVTPEEILSEEVIVAQDRIVIRDKKGDTVFEITNPDVIDRVSNEVTGFVGLELSRRQKSDGLPYVLPKEAGTYSFGEIKEALVEFLLDQAHHDSKNLLKDATILLMEGEENIKLSRPA